jgi:hypothetical protein
MSRFERAIQKKEFKEKKNLSNQAEEKKKKNKPKKDLNRSSRILLAMRT